MANPINVELRLSAPVPSEAFLPAGLLMLRIQFCSWIALLCLTWSAPGSMAAFMPSQTDRTLFLKTQGSGSACLSSRARSTISGFPMVSSLIPKPRHCYVSTILKDAITRSAGSSKPDRSGWR